MSTIGKPIKCRAAVLWKSKGPLTVETIEVKPPVGTEVRVKIIASGVCHSDLIDYTESGLCLAENKFPYVPGHEGSGIVESVGDEVTNVEPGDQVFVMFFGKCKTCADCSKGLTNYCGPSLMAGQVSLTTGQAPFSVNGETLYRFLGTSSFSEYTVVEQERVVKIEQKGIDLRTSCLLACGVSTGYGSAINLAGVIAGSSVAVWGLGTLGLAAGLGASHQGASMVIGVDLNPDKFAIAKSFGFTHFVNPKDLPEDKTTPQAIKELTNDIGVDYVVVCVGIPAAARDAVNSLALKPTSRAALVGLSPPGATMQLDLAAVFCGVTVTGGLYGGYKHEDISGLVDMAISGKIDLSKFITSQRPLNDIKEAFDDLAAAKVLRTIILLDSNYNV